MFGKYGGWGDSRYFGNFDTNAHVSSRLGTITYDDYAGCSAGKTPFPPKNLTQHRVTPMNVRLTAGTTIAVPSERQPPKPMATGRRRAVAIVAVIVGACLSPRNAAEAQFGQSAMAPSGGLVNRAVTGLQELNDTGPGWLYYGINAADRGLGYRGSYMTLGGFIPYAEDDLGGLWSADLRSHLSNYGGFFSNVGLVRKQFVGGTLMGVGVFWDYDGDQNQYSDTTITDTDLAGKTQNYVFSGGETYQQVGVSGEWLTDWGNLRSNGYIPVGNTASIMGPFVGNSLLCVNGINAALAGTDLEVGAYLPGLSDWAGMVSVGGYAFGNARYNAPSGQDVVPYFGGVYTRLDMTFSRNWDFSLQANNDSYFDWTGFARLTYRMGGSRRRNVSEQTEQPMMRNEHIVRAHQAPEQAINPQTGKPWRVIHVDNSMPAGGTGTAETPFNTLAAGQAAADAEFDVVYMHVGLSQTDPYVMRDAVGDPIPYTFLANNQYLIGEGSSLLLNSVDCGLIRAAPQSNGIYPAMSNPLGTAIVLTDSADPLTPGTTANATVNHVKIVGSQIAISDGGGLPAAAPTAPNRATVRDVQIVGTGANQRGVEIRDRAGNNATFDFSYIDMKDMTEDGFYVNGALGSPRVNITDSRIRNTGGSAVYATNLFNPGRVRVSDTLIDKTTAAAIYVKDAELTLVSGTIRTDGLTGVYAEDNSIVQVAYSRFENVDIGIQGTASAAGSQLYLTANANRIITTPPGNGIVLSVPSPATGADVYAYILGNSITAGNGDDILLFDGTPSGLPGSSNLWIKAADTTNLRTLNANATVRQVYPFSPTPTIPAPPNWDAALVVPLPAP